MLKTRNKLVRKTMRNKNRRQKLVLQPRVKTRQMMTMMNYNPPYYPDLWEGAGFRVFERYYSMRVDDARAAELQADQAALAGIRERLN